MRCHLALALALSTGCLFDDRVTTEQIAGACALAGANGDWLASQAFVAGAPIVLSVRFEGCLSSSCDTDREATCRAVRDGSTLSAIGGGSYTRERSAFGQTVCTTDCGHLEATCATEPLEAGAYTIRIADAAVSVTVPSESTTAPCAPPTGF